MAQKKAEMTGTDTSGTLVLDANIMLRAVLGVRVRSLIRPRRCKTTLAGIT